MATKIIYLPRATHIKMALQDTIERLSAKVMDPEGDELGAVQIMPLVEAVDHLTDVAGKVEAMVMLYEYRIAAFEAALASGAAKPASDFAVQLDQRLTATQDLLRAVLERLDDVETALFALAKKPFIEIDPHDAPRKELAKLKAKFDVACPEPKGPAI
ncbi:MAG: hypothetical protein ACREED_02650 [Stellaceae bacterium]